MVLTDHFVCLLQFGMILEHGDAVGQIAVGSVVTQGHEATVQHDLISLWFMTDDASSHPDCDVVKFTGADSILLGVCNECTLYEHINSSFENSKYSTFTIR